uniref:Uncharacterized protein n=1 Tax=Anopheles culicifacies TaxID=139723 RepID=A0A182MVK7_9DIPT
MEDPDRDAVNVGEVRAKVNDTLTASLSSEDSWTLLGKDNDQPSGVQEEVDKEDVTVEKGAHQSIPKQRHDSHRSTDSQMDESDGISVISESDSGSSDKMLMEEESFNDQESTLHFTRNINLRLPDYVPLTPPYTPDEPKPTKQETNESKSELQIKRSDAGEQSVETVNSVVEHSHPAPVSNANWLIFSLIATGMVAVILGNSMRLQSRVEEVNFEHEKRISELELENNILKNEMNKLRHLYTRSELDEQVQRAEFKWMDVLNQDPPDEPIEQMETVAENQDQPPIRIVPPQDGGVKRKVVWSGDEEEPMLIVDKDYVLPAFCYKQDQAVHDDLFSEYSAKYCDIKKRKIEAKQKKTEFQQKKQTKPENYNKFIHPKASEQPQERRTDPSKPASPFNIDYQKAFDAIKAEGSVIVEALGSILDLSPEPEETLKARVMDAVTPESSGNIAPEDKTPTPTDTPVSRDAEKVSSEYLESSENKDSGRQRYDDRKQGKHRENEYNRKEDKSKRRDEKEYNKQKDNNSRSMSEDGRKPKRDSREEGRPRESKDRKKEYREKDKYENVDQNSKEVYRSNVNKDGDHHGKDKNYHKRKNDGHHSEDNYRKHYHDDDDDDDHHKKKFKSREDFKERDYKGKPHHTDHHRDSEERRGSGERPKQRYDSEEGSYLEQYKRTEWSNGDRRRDDNQDYDKHHKKHDRNQRQQHGSGDWNEKRYKGRDEYRQNGGKHGERGSGDHHWQERMKHGRQAARDEKRQQMERESNWYLERGNQREEDRIFPNPDSQPR